MRAGKSILVWAAALMMIANPASACRWRVRSYCGPAYSGPSYCAPTYCGPVYSEPSCATSMPADCSACGEISGAPVTTNHAPEVAPPEPTTPQPTFEPAPTDAPPADVTPAPPAAVPPGTEPEPFAAPPEDMPAEAPATTPAPAAAPAPDKVEDLFSEPPATPAEPTEKPAAPSSDVEDLFKDPAPAPTTPEKPADEVDDLFKDLDDKKAAVGDTPSEAPTAPDNKELEDLFSDPQPEAPMSAAPVPATPMEEVVAAEPNTPTPIVEVKAVQPAPQAGMRLWTDDTGKFQVRGRLVVVGPTNVRLLKENGKFTTVPYGRLSQADLAFVKQHSSGAVVASF
jgi:hypothetical protein